MNFDKSTSTDKMCIIEKNSITLPEPMSLDNPNCIISETYFYQQCTCNFAWIKALSKVDLKKSSSCRIQDIWERCLGAEVFNVMQFDYETCRPNGKFLDCVELQKKKKPSTDERFTDPKLLHHETTKKDIFLYIYIGVGTICALFVLILVVLSSRQYYLRRKLPPIPLSDVQSNQNTISQMKGSKSFSNDDRRIISQTLETMRTKHTREQYDQVYNNTKKLLEGNLTESEKVLTIGDIVRTIEECQNTGEDFVAFTGILYNHLAPKDSNQNDPVYSEPMLLRGAHSNDEDGQTILDHIYAEPSSVQQPLLTNEYATPLDRRNESVYSEPVLNERGMLKK